MAKDKDLSPQQILFAYNYIRNGFKDATRAYVEAGYADTKGAGPSASRLLTNVKVKHLINVEREKLEKEMQRDLKLSNDDIKNWWANIMLSPSASESMRMKASENLARARGIYNEAGTGNSGSGQLDVDRGVRGILQKIGIREQKRTKKVRKKS